MVNVALRVAGLQGICVSAALAQPKTQSFTVEWPADASSPADVSFLLRAPAGKDGFIRINAGHLVCPDGSRRSWGVNMTGKAGLPDKAHFTYRCVVVDHGVAVIV